MKGKYVFYRGKQDSRLSTQFRGVSKAHQLTKLLLKQKIPFSWRDIDDPQICIKADKVIEIRF